MTFPLAFHGQPRHSEELSQHATFNKKADLVMAGAVYSGVQSSTYIRPRQQLECNGFDRPAKYLQEHDLKNFAGLRNEMDAVLHYIRSDPFFENNSAIAYRIFHWHGQTRTVHGVIVTDSEHRLLRRFDREDLGMWRSMKSSSVLDFCLPYISHQNLVAAGANY